MGIKPHLLLSPDYLCAYVGNNDLRVHEADERFYTLSRLARGCKRGVIPYKEKKVRTICGSSIRKMADVTVTIDSQDRDVWADIVTGSLYDKSSGRCLSGPLQIV